MKCVTVCSDTENKRIQSLERRLAKLVNVMQLELESELKTKVKELNEELDFAHAKQKIEESMWVCSLKRKPNKRDTQHLLEFWNRIMSNPKLFYMYVRMTQERFDDIHKRFVEYMEEHPDKTPQFSDIFVTQGNVCRYMSKYYLFMIIAYLRCGLSQWKIGGLFDLDQGTVSRHLAYVSNFLETNSTLVENIFEKITSCKTTRVQEMGQAREVVEYSWMDSRQR